MLDMEDPVIGDDLKKIEQEVRAIAETIWGYDEVGEGERGVAIMRRVLDGSYGGAEESETAKAE